MNEFDEEILKELRRQSQLLESIENRQRETNGYVWMISIVVVLAILLPYLFS